MITGMRSHPVTFSEPFLLRHPWAAAFLLGTVATPGAVILAFLLPRPIDLLFAWPLVVMDMWFQPANIGTGGRPVYEGSPLLLLALLGGILFTWAFYVLAARVAVWRVSTGRKI